MLIETLLPEPRVERFDQCIVCRSTRSTEIQLDLVPVRPAIEVLRDKLRSIVHLDPFRKSVCPGDAFQSCHHVNTSDLGVRLEGQTLACVVLHYHQHPEPSIVKELIGDEVHTPAIVLHQGSGSDLPLSTRDTAAGRFLAHYQAFLAVEAVDPFVVNLPAFTPEKDVEPAVAVGDSDTCQIP
jgi:hypothetical protein